MSECIFISGHLDLTTEEFAAHYVLNLHRFVQAKCTFVVGDAAGCDHMVQEWFDSSFPLGGAPLTVYHMFVSPRDHGFPTAEVFRCIGGFQNDRERDEAMTKASSRDLAWVRPGREKSGTAKNLARRLRLV